MNDRNSNASMVGDTNLLSGIGCAGSLFSYIFLSLIPLVIMFLNVYLSIIVSIASTLIFVTFIFIYKQSYDDRKHIDSINFHQCLIMMLSMIFVLISVIPLLENIFELSETSMAICAIAATTFFIIFSVFISDLLKNDDDSTANDWNKLSFISFLFSFILIVQYIK